jgi:hypothetical protein
MKYLHVLKQNMVPIKYVYFTFYASVTQWGQENMLKMKNRTLFKVVAKQSQKVHKIHWILWQPNSLEEKMKAENPLSDSMM